MATIMLQLFNFRFVEWQIQTIIITIQIILVKEISESGDHWWQNSGLFSVFPHCISKFNTSNYNCQIPSVDLVRVKNFSDTDIIPQSRLYMYNSRLCWFLGKVQTTKLISLTIPLVLFRLRFVRFWMSKMVLYLNSFQYHWGRPCVRVSCCYRIYRNNC